jgi:hypothetical protein
MKTAIVDDIKKFNWKKILEEAAGTMAEVPLIRMRRSLMTILRSL